MQGSEISVRTDRRGCCSVSVVVEAGGALTALRLLEKALPGLRRLAYQTERPPIVLDADTVPEAGGSQGCE